MPKVENPFLPGTAFKDFNKLKTNQKASTIILSTLALIFTLGIAFVPAFKSLVNRFKKENDVIDLSPGANKTHFKVRQLLKKIPDEAPQLRTEQFAGDPPPLPHDSQLTSEEKALIGNKKYISPSTQGALHRLNYDVQTLLPGKKLSKTIDNGDCFFDAFAQGLSQLLKRQVTAQELRQIVSLYANSTLWPQTYFGKRIVEYQDWKMHIDKQFSDGHPDALWGKPELDGQILATHFNVRLRIISETYLDEENPDILEESNRLFDDLTYIWQSKGQPESKKTVVIGNYPGHFLAVV